MILGRLRALEPMKLRVNLSKHQVLDNEESGAYKDAIWEIRNDLSDCTTWWQSTKYFLKGNPNV